MGTGWARSAKIPRLFVCLYYTNCNIPGPNYRHVLIIAISTMLQIMQEKWIKLCLSIVQSVMWFCRYMYLLPVLILHSCVSAICEIKLCPVTQRVIQDGDWRSLYSLQNQKVWRTCHFLSIEHIVLYILDHPTLDNPMQRFRKLAHVTFIPKFENFLFMVIITTPEFGKYAYAQDRHGQRHGSP